MLDILEQPSFGAERVNQALFGTPVIVNREQYSYVEISKPDSYTGWCDTRFVKKLTKTAYQELVKETLPIVKSNRVRVYQSKKAEEQVDPYLLFYGTRIFGKKVDAQWYKIQMPDNSSRYIRSAHIAPIHSKKEVSGRMLVEEAKKFLGVPYLWGGLTTPGLDCSGLIQIICTRLGISMPRDTKEQISVGVETDRDDIKTGDLLFFDRHVGIAIGKNGIIHSSAGGNGVRIESLSKQEPNYRRDLDKSFKTARRII